jgi:hypothetical protein
MTTDKSLPEDGTSVMTPQDTLRAAILNSALYDWVPLIEVNQDITRDNLADTPQEQRELALRTIRSLLEDGLMGIGDLPGAGERVPDCGLSIEEAIQRVHDRYVVHHDDPVAWEFTIWLGLTDKGKTLAETPTVADQSQLTSDGIGATFGSPLAP